MSRSRLARQGHPDTLRDELWRIEARAWEEAQRVGVRVLYARGLVQGQVDAVDGSGRGPGLRLVCLVHVGGERPLLVAWRLLEGDASENGKETAVTRELVEQAMARGGEGGLRLLLADALYADGPLLVWLKYAQGIDALVALPSDRLLYEDLQGLARGDLIRWTRPRYVRTVQGYKQRRVVEVASPGGLTSWDGFTAAKYGSEGASLGGAGPPDGAGAEAGRGGRGVGQRAALGQRVRGVAGVPPALAHRGRRLPGVEGGVGAGGAALGPVRGRGAGPGDPDVLGVPHGAGLPPGRGPAPGQEGDPPPAPGVSPGAGGAPGVVYVAGCYAVLSVEDLLAALGRPVQESLVPSGGPPPAPAPQEQSDDPEKPP